MNQTIDLGFEELTQAVRDLDLDSASITIERFDGTQVNGAEDRNTDANWDEVTGLIDLPCMAARDIFTTRITQSREIKATDRVDRENFYHVQLCEYISTIRQDDRAVLTMGSITRTLDIIGVEHDSQSTQTRLALRDRGIE